GLSPHGDFHVVPLAGRLNGRQLVRSQRFHLRGVGRPPESSGPLKLPPILFLVLADPNGEMIWPVVKFWFGVFRRLMRHSPDGNSATRFRCHSLELEPQAKIGIVSVREQITLVQKTLLNGLSVSADDELSILNGPSALIAAVYNPARQVLA